MIPRQLHFLAIPFLLCIAAPSPGGDHRLYGGFIIEDKGTWQPDQFSCQPICYPCPTGICCDPLPPECYCPIGPCTCRQDFGMLKNWLELSNPSRRNGIQYSVSIYGFDGVALPGAVGGTLNSLQSVRILLDPYLVLPGGDLVGQAHYLVGSTGPLEGTHEIERLDTGAGNGETLRLRYLLSDTAYSHVDTAQAVFRVDTEDDTLPVVYLQNPASSPVELYIRFSASGEAILGGAIWDGCVLRTIPGFGGLMFDPRDFALPPQSYAGFLELSSVGQGAGCPSSTALGGAFAARVLTRWGELLAFPAYPAQGPCPLPPDQLGWAEPALVVPQHVLDVGP